MYTQQDIDNAKSQLMRMVIVSVAILLVGLAATITALVFRIRWLTDVLAILTVWLVYSHIALKLMPHYHYRKFLVDMQSGLSRETEGWFVTIAEEPRKSDGVLVHELIIRVGDAEEDERLFFWDDDKPAPAIQPGQRVHIRSYGNYIIGLSAT